MNLALIFDVETTGFPEWQEPSDSPKQPHIVQLAALLVDLDERKVIQSIDLIVKPDGWEIPKEVSDIHGITQEIAEEVGIPEIVAVDTFLKLWNGCKRIAHNRTFDQRIIRIACKRFFNEDIQEAWADKDDFDCTMLMAKPVMELPFPSGKAGIKQPNLAEAYKFFTGEELKNAHSALADAKACMEVYFGLME